MAEVVVPRSAVLGSREQIAADLKVGREYAGDVEHDARPLVRCYRRLREGEAHLKWRKDGPLTWEEFCQEALGYDAAFLDAVDEGVSILESEGHIGEISAEEAQSASKFQLAAQRTTSKAVLGHGGDRRSGERSSSTLLLDPHRVRAARNGIGARTQQKLDRLARDFPDLLSKVRSGELTATAADRMASGKPKTISVLLEPASAAETIRRHFTPEQIAELVRLLEGEVRA